MTKSDWQDTMIGVIGLVAALTALYVSLRPASKASAPATPSSTIIEPSSTQGFSGSVGSGSPAPIQYTGQQIAANPYGSAPAFPSSTLSPASGGNIIFPPLQDEGLTVPALAPVNNHFEFCNSCGLS